MSLSMKIAVIAASCAASFLVGCGSDSSEASQSTNASMTADNSITLPKMNSDVVTNDSVDWGNGSDDSNSVVVANGDSNSATQTASGSGLRVFGSCPAGCQQCVNGKCYDCKPGCQVCVNGKCQD